MRRFALLVVFLGVGCEAGEAPPYHGAGGGGHTSTGDAPDADPFAPDAEVSRTLTGTVCVIQSWDTAASCPPIALAQDVLIADLATGGATTRSDNAGAFSFDLLDGSGAVIQTGGEGPDLLTSTQSVVSAADSPVEVPAIDEGLWNATLANLLETQTAGAGVIYVVDPNGPVSNAMITFTSSVPDTARVYYDDGIGGFDPAAMLTGPDGVALVLDVQSVGVRATADDSRTATAQLPTAALEVGVVVITLPAP